MTARRRAVSVSLALALAAAGVSASAPGCRDGGAPPARAGSADAGGERGRPAAPDRSAVAGLDPGGRGWVGVIAARDAIDVAAEVAGRVAEVRVRIGDRVEAGQVVATLDQRPFRDELNVALASERAARAALKAADVEVAEAERTLAREQQLHARGTTAASQLEAAQFARDRALAARERAAADAAERSARVAQLRLQLDRTAIAAPFAGEVSVRYLDPGAVAAPGAPVVRLIAAGAPWVVFAAPPEHARALRPGDRVRVHVEPDVEPAGASIPATVRHVAPELEPASQMIVVEAEIAPSGAAGAGTAGTAGTAGVAGTAGTAGAAGAAGAAGLKAGQAARVYPASPGE